MHTGAPMIDDGLLGDGGSRPAVHDDGELLAIQRAEDDDRGRGVLGGQGLCPCGQCVPLQSEHQWTCRGHDEGGVERTEVVAMKPELRFSWREFTQVEHTWASRPSDGDARALNGERCVRVQADGSRLRGHG